MDCSETPTFYFKNTRHWRTSLKNKKYAIFFRVFRWTHPAIFEILRVTRRKKGVCLVLGKKITHDDSPIFKDDLRPYLLMRSGPT